MSTELNQVLTNIHTACSNIDRPLEEVQLIAVSKTWPAEKLEPLIDAGQRVFGENKVQELEVKASTLSQELEWHFIGGLQRNKVRKVLAHATWIHSVDTIKLLEAINRIAGEENKKPHLLLQVNIDQEETKGGFSEEVLPEVLTLANNLPHITLEGLMAIPAPQSSPELVAPAFKRLRALRDKLQLEMEIPLPHLSMGMSSDYSVAIQEGATLVRVGSALFGNRNYAQ